MAPTCRTFANQPDLDAAKARINTSLLGRMSDQEIISWIVGLSPPPASATTEATCSATAC